MWSDVASLVKCLPNRYVARGSGANRETTMFFIGEAVLALSKFALNHLGSSRMNDCDRLRPPFPNRMLIQN